MKKPARASAPESQRSQWLERLTDAVNHLADEARVLRDTLDETREHLDWIARNGIPGRQGEQTPIVRMASNPLAPDANEILAVLTSKAALSNSSELSSGVFDELVSEIAGVVTVVGQEQLNVLLTALDDVRAKLVVAIKASAVSPNDSEESTAGASSQTSTSQAPAKPSEMRSLF